MKHRTRWLDRRIAAPGPHLALCLSESEFVAAMAHCNVKSPPPWLNSTHSHATVHFLEHTEHGLTAIVAMNEWANRDPVEVAGLLVHEAVHIWQEYADHIGERTPGREQEAYAVQAIAQELMAEFARRIGQRT